MNSFLPLLLFSTCYLTYVTSQDRQVIDIEWKFDHILIIPVGCSWAQSVVWRISLKCPAGTFVVPTRLQASSNRTKFCGVNPASEPPQELYDGDTLTLQKKNPYPDPKQARRYSHEFFANGKLNRHDNPYFPIYNTSTQLWDCVGDREDASSCVFTVNASDFRGMEVSHASERKNNMTQLMMTLVLPGPYCSTADIFEHYDRYGGVVYKMHRNTSTGSVFYQLGRDNFEGSEEEDEGYTLEPPVGVTSSGELQQDSSENYKLKPDKTSLELSRNPKLQQSEDVYLVIGHEKGAPQLNHCILTLIPRDPTMTRNLYSRDKDKFINSVLANIHVHFIQVTYNGYSTFYDDMTAIQHSHSWRNMFSVLDFDPSTAMITLAVNFEMVRTVDQRKVRVGLALYEVLVVGDPHAALLGSSWPYRYMSPTREVSSRTILFKNVTVGECLSYPRLRTTTENSIVVTASKDNGATIRGKTGSTGSKDKGSVTRPPNSPGRTVWPIIPIKMISTTTKTTPVQEQTEPYLPPTVNFTTSAPPEHKETTLPTEETTPTTTITTASTSTTEPEVVVIVEEMPAKTAITAEITTERTIPTTLKPATETIPITLAVTPAPPLPGMAGGNEGTTAEPRDNGWGVFLENMWAWWIWAVIGTLVGIVVFATIGAFCFCNALKRGVHPVRRQGRPRGSSGGTSSLLSGSSGSRRSSNEKRRRASSCAGGPMPSSLVDTSSPLKAGDGDEEENAGNEPLLMTSFPSTANLNIFVSGVTSKQRKSLAPNAGTEMSKSASTHSIVMTATSDMSHSSSALKLIAHRAVTKARAKAAVTHSNPTSPNLSAYRRPKQFSVAGRKLSVIPSEAAMAALHRCESVGDQKMREYLLFVAET